MINVINHPTKVFKPDWQIRAQMKLSEKLTACRGDELTYLLMHPLNELEAGGVEVTLLVCLSTGQDYHDKLTANIVEDIWNSALFMAALQNPATRELTRDITRATPIRKGEIH